MNLKMEEIDFKQDNKDSSPNRKKKEWNEKKSKEKRDMIEAARRGRSKVNAGVAAAVIDIPTETDEENLVNDPPKHYEWQLQKLESEIRNHIRIE